MSRQETAKTLINRAAVECGLSSASDPFASTDQAFVQMAELLNSCGQELVELASWQALRKEHSFTVDIGVNATGIYDLPDDFAYMIPQTQWDKTNDNPLGGPLSAQNWSYLDGRGLASSTIYASFRLTDNKLYLWPQPPPDGVEIRFEYISRNWATDTTGSTAKDYVTVSDDIVLLEPIMVVKFLKVKYKDAKGFDSAAARQEFENMFLSRTSKDKSAPVLSASGRRSGLRLIDANNIPDAGYGI